MLEPTRVLAIRHGETAWNADGRLQGQLDIPLNGLGRRQAARLAQALQHEGLVTVVASDLARAWQTAEAFCQPLGLPLSADAGLRERCFGVFEGQRLADLDIEQADLARRWRAREPDFAPEGAETLTVFAERCVGTAARLAQAHTGQAIALVCHGGVLDCLYRAATGLALDAPRTWVLGNAAINRLLYTAQGFTLVGWNDQGHLDGLARDEIH